MSSIETLRSKISQHWYWKSSYRISKISNLQTISNLRVSNSISNQHYQWTCNTTLLNSDWVTITQLKVLEASCLIPDNHEKTTLYFNMPYLMQDNVMCFDKKRVGVKLCSVSTTNKNQQPYASVTYRWEILVTGHFLYYYNS